MARVACIACGRELRVCICDGAGQIVVPPFWRAWSVPIAAGTAVAIHLACSDVCEAKARAR